MVQEGEREGEARGGEGEEFRREGFRLSSYREFVPEKKKKSPFHPRERERGVGGPEEEFRRERSAAARQIG